MLHCKFDEMVAWLWLRATILTLDARWTHNTAFIEPLIEFHLSVLKKGWKSRAFRAVVNSKHRLMNFLYTYRVSVVWSACRVRDCLVSNFLHMYWSCPYDTMMGLVSWMGCEAVLEEAVSA